MTTYGDYNGRVSTQQSTQTEDPIRTTSPQTSSPADSKTQGVSLGILAKAGETSTTNPTKSLTETEVNPNAASDETPSTVNSVSTPILHSTQTHSESHVSQELLQADLQRMNSITSSSEHPVSKFDGMTEDELIDALDDPDNTPEDIEEIEARLDKLTDQAQEAFDSLSIDHTRTLDQIAEEAAEAQVHKAETVDIQAAAKAVVKGLIKLNNDGTASAVRPDEDISKLAIGRYDEETGTLEVPAEYMKKFKGGQISFKDENGVITQREISELKTLSKEEETKIRDAFISLNPHQIEVPEERHHLEGHHEFRPREHESRSSTTTTTQTTHHHHLRNERGSGADGAQGTSGRSSKEINERRIMQFIKAIEKKLEQIKKQVKAEEITQAEIKRDNLIQAIKKENVTYESLQATFVKQNAEYKDLLAKLRQPSGGAEIPLATIEKYETIAIEFERIAKLVPTFKSTNKEIPEALMETVSLQKQIMKVITDMINMSGNEVRTGTGHDGKTAAPGA